MEDIKTMRICLIDKTKDIPITLYDSYLKSTVRLNPDALVSEEYGKELLKSYSCYKQIGKDEIVDKTGYLIRPDYMQKDLDDIFKKLNPNEREYLVAEAEKLIADRDKKADTNSQTQVANEIPDNFVKAEGPVAVVTNPITEGNGEANNSTEDT